MTLPGERRQFRDAAALATQDVPLGECAADELTPEAAVQKLKDICRRAGVRSGDSARQDLPRTNQTGDA